MEDEIISLLDELDALENGGEDERGGTERQPQQLTRSKRRNWRRELNSIAEELAVCVGKSDELKKKIPADSSGNTIRSRAIGRGVAVVSVWKEVCDGCHMSIPPQLYNELQKSTRLLTCPNCNRIIYWENRNNGQ